MTARWDVGHTAGRKPTQRTCACGHAWRDHNSFEGCLMDCDCTLSRAALAKVRA